MKSLDHMLGLVQRGRARYAAIKTASRAECACSVDRSVDCVWCEGRGYVYVSDPTSTCPHCEPTYCAGCHARMVLAEIHAEDARYRRGRYTPHVHIARRKALVRGLLRFDMPPATRRPAVPA